MSPVDGSRHYQGPGLGQIGVWQCPSCGEDNEGSLTQGCVHCGAGKPVVAPPPAPPRVSERAPDDPTYREPQSPNEYTRWVAQHPDATLEQAFIAGYVEGIRAARQAQLAQERPMGDATPDGTLTITSPLKAYRTIVAALALFRDQVLDAQPEEVSTGEWMSADETTTVIRELQEQLNG